jgi:hypothetical protein
MRKCALILSSALSSRDPARNCETTRKAMSNSVGCRRSYSCAPERLIPDQVGNTAVAV